MIKAVIFDLDGTILDTEKYYRICWPKACAHFGFHVTEEMYLQMRSLGRPFAIEKFNEWFGDSFDYNKVRQYRKELYSELVKKEGIHPKKGAVRALEMLRERNILRAIATATDMERTTEYLKMAGLENEFDKICSAADCRFGKPAPDVYLNALKELGLTADECIAAEDAPNGIISASDAGLRVVFVPDQSENEPEVEGRIFAKIGSLDEIINVIDSL